MGGYWAIVKGLPVGVAALTATATTAMRRNISEVLFIDDGGQTTDGRKSTPVQTPRSLSSVLHPLETQTPAEAGVRTNFLRG
jgi:hypothetical protein